MDIRGASRSDSPLLIALYAVNFPWQDDWAVGPPLFDKLAHGNFHLSDLFAQHNEHRIVVTRLVTMALAPLTHWDLRAQMLVIYLLACITSVNIALLARQTDSQPDAERNNRSRWFLWFVANLLLFGPIQMENWLWGMQIQFLVPAACLTGGLLTLRGKWPVWGKVFFAMVLALVSTYSTANGIFLWGLLLPPLVLGLRTLSPRKRYSWITAWIVAAAVTTLLYFHGYQKPLKHPPLTESLSHPAQFLQYFCAFLGSPLGFGTVIGPVAQSVAMGACGVVLFLCICIFAASRRHAPGLFAQWMPWIIFGAYALANAGVTAVGRLGFGIEQALSSRYTTLAVPLWIALVYLVPALLSDAINREDAMSVLGRLANRLRPLGRARAISFACAALLALHLFSSVAAIDFCRAEQIRRRYGKACLLLLPCFHEDNLDVTIMGDLAELPARAHVLEEVGYLRPHMFTDPHVWAIRAAAGQGFGPAPSANGSAGFIDNVRAGGGQMALQGWAVIPGDRHRPADGVLLSWQVDQGEPVVFAVAQVGSPRDDAVKKLDDSAALLSGWGKVVPLSRLSAARGGSGSQLIIHAWALDADSGRIYELAGAANLKMGG